jgi:hypothetical protein
MKPNTLKMDAAESAFVARQLDFIKAQTYDIKFPTLKAREMVPVSNETPAGMNQVTYKSFEEYGVAEVVAGRGRDVPRVDVAASEFTRPIRMIADAWGWTLQEAKAAAAGMVDLDMRRARAGRMAIERKLDEIACYGEPEHGIEEGALNNGDVGDTPAAGLWSAATPDEIITDVGAQFSAIVSGSNDIEQPDTLAVPPSRFVRLTTLRLTDTGSNVRGYLESEFGLSVESWYRLEDVGGAPRSMLYRRSPDVLQQEIPLDFEQLPVQEQGIEFLVHAVAMTAGVSFYYPGAARYQTGL